jgi:hypothetical protein
VLTLRFDMRAPDFGAATIDLYAAALDIISPPDRAAELDQELETVGDPAGRHAWIAVAVMD